MELERYVVETVEKIVAGCGEECDASSEARGAPAEDLWSGLSASGLIGIGLPEEYGGGGQGIFGLCHVAEKVAKSGNLPVLLVMSPGIVGSMLLASGTAEQKDRFLPGIACGATRFAFAITESEAGSNTYRTKTSLVPDGASGFRLNGSKCFISGVEQADFILVVARIGDSGASSSLACCIIPSDAEGLAKQRIETESFSADSQWLLYFDDVRVGSDDVVGGLDSGIKSLFAGLNPERILMAAFCNGIGLRALDLAIDYARNREVWGVPIATHQAIAHPLASSKIEIELARNMTYAAANAFDSAGDCGALSNYAKFSAARAACAAVDRSIQAHGGNGFSRDYRVSELYWPARLFRIAPVSEEMILNFVAGQVLGLPKSY